MGLQSIITYFVIYTLGLLIGQDIWQRVFTARSPQVARWEGTAAGVYCILYGVAGAVTSRPAGDRGDWTPRRPSRRPSRRLSSPGTSRRT
jgi:Na+/proline symporter